MSVRRSAVVAAAVAVTTTGCGLGPGESSPGEATLTVTRDYGAERILDATESEPSESETVIRFLDREAEITTRYGGGFVQSIDGVSGEVADGRSRDWFFFVDGLESRRGSAEVPVRGGDRIWWDYRDWTAAISTPAVVGSWPEPFAQASTPADDRAEIEIQCLGARRPCDQASSSVEREGADAELTDAPGPAPGPRLVIGTWSQIAADPVAAELADGPATSGVFARFERRPGGWDLVALDQRGEPARTLGPGAGLVAGLRRGEQPPTWVVTGTDPRGVERAAGLLDAGHLAQRYAVAVAGGTSTPVPVRAG